MRVFLGSVFAFATLLASGEPPAAPRPDHPLLGSWMFDFPDRDCSETYRFFPDGTTLDTSGDEVSESAYEISPKPVENGFYKLVSKITKDNGKKDCLGEITKVGETSTNYVIFRRGGESFVMCRTPSLDSCFGPLVRMQGKAA
jgi:hypothetical protein